MARVNIDGLPVKGTVDGANKLMVQDAGVTKSLLISLINQAINHTFTPTGTIAATNVQAAIAEVASEAATATSTVSTNLATHIANPTDAHDASAVSAVATGRVWLVGANAQTQLDSAEAFAVAMQAGFTAHLNDPTDAHDASAISFVPTGTIAATDVQAAIAEVGTEKVQGLNGTTGLWIGTQAEYNALTPVSTVVYIITA